MEVENLEKKTSHLKFGKLAPNLIGQRDREVDGKKKGMDDWGTPVSDEAPMLTLKP